jgi:hypothetical protein
MHMLKETTRRGRIKSAAQEPTDPQKLKAAFEEINSALDEIFRRLEKLEAAARK